jgi:uncharacterized protein YndB with AHSA1/START domain
MNKSIASASAVISATPAEVWHALTTPELVREYMFGSDVQTDWKKGSEIRFTGEHEGRRYEDKGTIEMVAPRKCLAFTHWSSMSGEPDTPENHHLVTYKLERSGRRTKITVSEENVPTEKLEECSGNWAKVLDGLKKIVAH